jgi:SAM-dependent methyltransferase
MTESRAGELYATEVSPLWDEAVAAVWSPRVAGLALDSTALVAAAHTGALAHMLCAALPGVQRWMVVESERELLDHARRRPAGSAASMFFQTQGVRSLSFADDVFGLAAAAPLTASIADSLNALAELARVTRPDGWVLFALPLGSSLGLFDDLLEETFFAHGLSPETLAEWRETRNNAAAVEQAMGAMGLDVVDRGAVRRTLQAADGGALWSHPLVQRAFVPRWSAVGEDAATASQVVAGLETRVTTYWEGVAVETALEGCWWLCRVQTPPDAAFAPSLGARTAPAPGVQERTQAIDMADILAEDLRLSAQFTAVSDEDDVQETLPVEPADVLQETLEVDAIPLRQPAGDADLPTGSWSPAASDNEGA